MIFRNLDSNAHFLVSLIIAIATLITEHDTNALSNSEKAVSLQKKVDPYITRKPK